MQWTVTCQIAAWLERIGRIPTSRAKVIRVSFKVIMRVQYALHTRGHEPVHVYYHRRAYSARLFSISHSLPLPERARIGEMRRMRASKRTRRETVFGSRSNNTAVNPRFATIRVRVYAPCVMIILESWHAHIHTYTYKHAHATHYDTTPRCQRRRMRVTRDACIVERLEPESYDDSCNSASSRRESVISSFECMLTHGQCIKQVEERKISMYAWSCN